MIAVRRSPWDDPPVGPAQLLDQRAQWPQLQRWLPEADVIVRYDKACCYERVHIMTGLNRAAD